MQSTRGSPISPPSPSFSDSSNNVSVSSISERVPKQEVTDSHHIHVDPTPRGPPVSRPVSPSSGSSVGDGPDLTLAEVDYDDTATCMWDDCGMVFTQLQTLIEHIHTECDKSFTRSDALAKHMRQQHHIEPPAPGRGGARKRKRNANDAVLVSNETPNAPPTGGFNTFKVEPDIEMEDFPRGFANGRSSRPGSPRLGGEDGEGDDSEDCLPLYLAQHFVPETGLVMGRTPPMAMYLLMKAKHKYALKEKESLLEELRVARAELKREKEQKEITLDRFLLTTFGQQAEQLVTPIPPPPGMELPASPDFQQYQQLPAPPPVPYPPTNGFAR